MTTTSHSDPQARYRRGAQTAAEFAGFTIWLATWLLNAYFTVLMAVLMGVPWWGGVMAHLVITLIEGHLWRSPRWGAWALVLLASFADVFSSAWGLQGFAVARGAPSGATSVIWAAVYTLLAIGIAILPERAGIGHVFALRRLVRRA